MKRYTPSEPPAKGYRDIDSFPSWPRDTPKLSNKPAYYKAEASAGYGLGEYGGIIFTGCRLKPLDSYSRDTNLLDEMLADYGPEVRIRMPQGGIVAGKTYLLTIEEVGNEDEEETVDAYWFAFTEKKS